MNKSNDTIKFIIAGAFIVLGGYYFFSSDNSAIIDKTLTEEQEQIDETANLKTSSPSPIKQKSMILF